MGGLSPAGGHPPPFISLFVRAGFVCSTRVCILFVNEETDFLMQRKSEFFFLFLPILLSVLTTYECSSIINGQMVKKDDKKFSLFFGVKHFSPSSETQIFSRVRRDKRAISRARFVSIVQPFG